MKSRQCFQYQNVPQGLTKFQIFYIVSVIVSVWESCISTKKLANDHFLFVDVKGGLSGC
jgi:hypothetical protein